MPWFASNTDLTIPSGRGIAPGNGAAVEVVRIATGAEPQVAGKPLPPMHRETVLRTGAKRPIVVGDRLDTDIEGAFNGGVDSLLVLTGVTDGARLLAAEPRHRPTYVDADLRGLLTGQPEVVVREGEFGCGGWTASVRGDALVLDGDELRPWTGCGRCAPRPGRTRGRRVRPGRGQGAGEARAVIAAVVAGSGTGAASGEGAVLRVLARAQEFVLGGAAPPVARELDRFAVDAALADEVSAYGLDGRRLARDPAVRRTGRAGRRPRGSRPRWSARTRPVRAR